MVPVKHIKRIPGIKGGAAKRLVQKARSFAEQRGCHIPVIVSEAEGCMTLLSGAATFEACLEERVAKIPAVIVQTGGDADELLFSLQSSELTAPPDAMYVSAAVVRLIDAYAVPRRKIAEVLGKSPAWVSRMEGLNRRLSDAVRTLVSDGFISSRAAQEIARLPSDAQALLAVSAGNEYLNKEDVTYLVNRYLDENTGAEERDRIIRAPKQALPEAPRGRGARAMDQSTGVRLTRAMARCLDSTSFLSRFLDHFNMEQAAVNASDAAALSAAMSSLAIRVRSMFCPGEMEFGADD
jgi:ParB-like chromosome segregation protein Spo0J